MREGSTLTYLHGDHLGSAFLATDGSGAVVGEMRYTPYGVTRSGTLDTDRRYTGQRWETSLGLYDYGARFYSPGLGRFVSADTIVPGAGEPQDLNRYAYVLDNPLKFIDPSGHLAVWEGDWVENPLNGQIMQRYSPLPKFWGRFEGNWPEPYRAEVIAGARAVGSALARAMQQNDLVLYKSGDIPNRGHRVTSREAFLQVLGVLTFRRSNQECANCWAETHVPVITVYANVFRSSYLRYGHLNTAHELGHAFAQRAGRQPYDDLDAAQIAYVDPNTNQNVPVAGGGWGTGYLRTDLGYALTQGSARSSWPWQQHRQATPNEDFADMFLGWSYNHFANDLAGDARYQWMMVNMPRWIALAVRGTP